MGSWPPLFAPADWLQPLLGWAGDPPSPSGSCQPLGNCQGGVWKFPGGPVRLKSSGVNVRPKVSCGFPCKSPAGKLPTLSGVRPKFLGDNLPGGGGEVGTPDIYFIHRSSILHQPLQNHLNHSYPNVWIRLKFNENNTVHLTSDDIDLRVTLLRRELYVYHVPRDRFHFRSDHSNFE